MPVDFQEESGPAATPAPALDFTPDPTYLSQIGPVMRQVMQEWGVGLAQPSETMSASTADTVNRTMARMVRKEAEKRLEEGTAAKILRGAQHAGVGLGKSLADPVNLALIGLSAVQPEIGLPIFAGMGAKQLGETAGTLAAPGATVSPEEKTEQLLTAGLMAVPVVATPIKAVKNHRVGVADAAEASALDAASRDAALREATRLSLPEPIEFVEESASARAPGAHAEAYQFPPEAAFFEQKPPAYSAKALPELIGGVFRLADGTIGRLTKTPEGRFALDDGQRLVELPGGPAQTAGELGLRAVSLGQVTGPEIGQYPAEPMPILSRLQTARNVAAFRRLSQAATQETAPATEPPTSPKSLPSLHPTSAALIEAVVKTGADKDAPLAQLYGALEAAPTARRILEGTIRRMEEAGATKAHTDPLYSQLDAIEQFENRYLDSTDVSGTKAEPQPPGEHTPAVPAETAAGAALPSNLEPQTSDLSNATQEGQQPPNVPPQPQGGDRGGPAAGAGPGDRLQPTAPSAAGAPAAGPAETLTPAPGSATPGSPPGSQSTAGSTPAPEIETTHLDPRRVSPTEVPVKDIQLSKDVPNFKAGASAITGVVHGEELSGKFEPFPVAPIVLWRRLDGRLEVITGRHRLDLARRSGEPTIWAQVVDEGRGFTRQMALTLDAESNIRDGQGSVQDYAHYFRNTPQLTEAEARSRGLLSRAKGTAGFDLGKYASDDLYALYTADKITEAQALAAVRAAPGNAAAQRIGARYALDGQSPAFISNLVKAAMAESHGLARNLDLFGTDDTALRAIEAQAKRAAKIQSELREQIQAVGGAAKKPDVARKMGVNIDDPEAVRAKVADLRAQLARWETWPMQPDLVALTKGESGTGVPPVSSESTASGGSAPAENTIPKLRPMEKGTGDLFQGEDAPFNLAGETAPDAERIAREKAAAEQAKAEAAAAAAKQQLPLPGTAGRVEASGAGAPRSGTGVPPVSSKAASAPPGPRPLRSLPKAIGVPAAVTGPAPPTAPVLGWFAQRLRGFRSVFAPASIDRASAYVAGVMREMIGRSANALSQADEAMKSWRREFDRTPVPADYAYDPIAPLPHNYAVIDALERNRAALPPRYQALADVFEKEFAWRIAEIQKFAPNALQHLYENYFPHIWQDAKRGADVMAQMATRLFAGRKEFLKQRSLPLFVEGLERGLKPISDNPVDLLLAKMHSMDKMILALRALDDFKATGHLKFKYVFERLPDGWTTIDDPAFIIHKPPWVTIKEAFDMQLRTRTYELLQKLGVPHSRLATLGGQRWGLAYESPLAIKTRFAAPESVTWHELGHALDFIYNLQKDFLNQGSAFNNQLRALADARDPSAAKGSSRQKYLRKAEEKMAVMLEAYVHAPEVFKRLAPDVHAKFSRFIGDHPELHDINNLKPSLELGTAETQVHAGGPILLGHWIMPESGAQVIRNYLSPGLQGSGVYRFLRNQSNLLNAAQLGLSGFHAGFTTLDVAFTTAELGLYQALRGELARGAKTVAGLPVAPIENYYSGKAVQSAMLRPKETHIPVLFGLGKLPVPAAARTAADLAVKAGLRATIDPFWQTTMTRNLTRAIHAGGTAWLKTPLYAPFALVEQTMRPLAEFLVPRQKLGAFARLAQSEMERVGLNASPDQVRAALARAADTVEDRMGQMTYDIQFQHRIAKDLALIAFRAYGWQLGKYRALLGATADTAAAIKQLATGKAPDITHRMTYAVALPLGVAAIGGVLHYLLSGRPPQTWIDYFHPATGRIDPNGNDQRLSLPTYLKDIESDARGLRGGWQSGGPLGSMRGVWDATYHRMNPWVSEAVDMLNNRDFYGTQIYNPDDPLLSKMAEQAQFLAKSALPFSFTGSQRLAQEENSLAARLLPFVGVVPARRELTMTPAQLRAAEIIQAQQPVGARTAEEFERSKQAKELARELKTDPLKGREALRDALAARQINPEQAARIVRSATMTPLQYQVWKMSADDAMKVWDLANPIERAQIAALIQLKLIRAREMPLETRQRYFHQLLKAPAK